MYDANEIDFDRHWKDVITDFLDSFLQLLEPTLFEKIDFSFHPKSMEQELYPLSTKQKKGKNIADKIFEVILKDQEKSVANIHIEVQGDGQDISERMFKTYYKLYDQHKKNIYSIVLVTHPSAEQTSLFYHNFFGTSMLFYFHVHHLSDFSESELIHSNNPFALALLAGQYHAQTRTDVEMRYTYKIKLTELIRKKYPLDEGDTGINLLKFVDNILYLPEDLREKYIQEVFQIYVKEGIDLTKAEKTKEVITFGELLERWKEEGREEGQLIEKQNIARKMAMEGLEFETIVSLTGLSEGEVKRLMQENQS